MGWFGVGFRLLGKLGECVGYRNLLRNFLPFLHLYCIFLPILVLMETVKKKRTL